MFTRGETEMHISKNEVPIKVNAPGAVARQKTEFGDATPYGMIGAEYFTMDAGTDIAPLLQGLENDLCQAPHWGYIVKATLPLLIITVPKRKSTPEIYSIGPLATR
jgi:hypothetical protein